jgi:hypothetical protein
MMAVWTVKKQSELSRAFVLAPERYDPRREMMVKDSAQSTTLLLGHIVQIVRKTVYDTTSGLRRCIVLDTSNAQEGIIIGVKAPVNANQIGSAKKVINRNDVIISRLRPYLRQVAFVDSGLRGWKDDVTLLGSTEFFILRSIDGESISFLVPFLLSAPVQQVLSASQEGGHHPRFNESTLLTLPIPEKFLAKRKEICAAVEHSVKLYRESEESLFDMVKSAGRIFVSPESETAHFINSDVASETRIER